MSVATIPLSTTKRARRSGPSKVDLSALGSDRLDVYGLRALVALLRVVGDLGPLLERAIALAVDSSVMDEQVLVAVIRGDEAETLVVAEPLYCASWHYVNSSTVCACCDAEDASTASTCERLHYFRRSCVPARPHDRSRSPCGRVVEMLRCDSRAGSGRAGQPG